MSCRKFLISTGKRIVEDQLKRIMDIQKFSRPPKPILNRMLGSNFSRCHSYALMTAKFKLSAKNVKWLFAMAFHFVSHVLNLS